MDSRKGKLKMIHIDCFDHDTTEPRFGKAGRSLDIHVLSTASRVSVFWITETQARAKRVSDWQERGILDLDNSAQYPWLRVAKFDAASA